jgi:hypothetical protein
VEPGWREQQRSVDATTSPGPLGDTTSSSSVVQLTRDRSFPLLGPDGQNHANRTAGADADDAAAEEAGHISLRRDERGRFPLLTVAQLGRLGTFRPEMLVPGKIMKRSLALTYGDGDTGKSYFVQDTCFGLAAAGVPIWYVAAEGFDGIYLRILAWQAMHPDQPLDALRVIPIPVQIFKGSDVATLAAQARDLPDELRPTMVVLDTLHRCAVGAREGDNGDMVCVANTAAVWRAEFGATTWVIHHEGKNAGQGMRGASCLYDDADSVQYIFRGGDISVVECEKQKDAIARFEPEAFTLSPCSLDEKGFPGLSAKVLEHLPSDQIIEARRIWEAQQQRRQSGAKNAVGEGDPKALSDTLERGFQVLKKLCKDDPDGVFVAAWKAGCVEAKIPAGSFHYVSQELIRKGKVKVPDTTGRYVPAD